MLPFKAKRFHFEYLETHFIFFYSKIVIEYLYSYSFESNEGFKKIWKRNS